MSDDVEAVQACLRDDAATLRDDNKECEIASNMDAAATLIGRLTEELAAANEARKQAEKEVAITRSCTLSPNPFPNGLNDHMPEFFAIPEVAENLAKAHPVLLVRNCANEILRLRAEVERLRDQAKADLASREQDAWRAGYDFAKLHFYDIPLRHSGDMYSFLAGALKERDALRAEVERLREDAERYRWLRRPTTLGVGMVNIWSKGQGRYDAWQGDELDAAIDAARKESK